MKKKSSQHSNLKANEKAKQLFRRVLQTVFELRLRKASAKNHFYTQLVFQNWLWLKMIMQFMKMSLANHLIFSGTPEQVAAGKQFEQDLEAAWAAFNVECGKGFEFKGTRYRVTKDFYKGGNIFF